MFKKFIFLIAFVSSACIFAQTHYWIQQLNSTENNNSNKLEYADSLVVFYKKSNPDSALIYARHVLYYAKILNDTGSVDYAFAVLGSLHRAIGNYDSSRYFYNLAMISYKEMNYEEGVASIYNNLATLYKTQGRYDLAIKNYIEALEIFEKGNNFNARGNLYSNFAGLYFRLENYQKAYDYWSLAEIDFVRDDSAYEITHCYRGHARLYLEWSELDKVEEELTKALKFDHQNKIDVFVLEDYLLFMELYNEQQSFSKFLKAADSAKYYLKTIDKPLNAATYYEQMGDYFISVKNQTNAFEMYNNSLNFLVSSEAPDLRLRVLKKILKTAIHLNLSNQASKFIDEIDTLETMVLELRRDRITQETDAEYDLKGKEERIGLLNEKNKTSEKLFKSERSLREKSQQQVYMLLIGIVVFFGFLVYVILSNRKLSRTQKELKKNVQEKEFLFRELNHRVKNNLHIVVGFLGIEMHGRSDEIVAILKTCERRIQSLGFMHELLYKNEITGGINVFEYIQKLKLSLEESLLAKNDILNLDVDHEFKLDTNKVVLLGLIINELITNSVKHGRVDDLPLTLELVIVKSNNKTTLIVSDNGKGISNIAVSSKNAIGMKLANGLAIQLGGKLARLETEIGTKFEITF